MGKIIKPHGLKGSFKVFLYNRNTENFNIGSKVWICIDNEYCSYNIEYANLKASKPYIKLGAYNTIEDLDRIINLEIFILREDLPKLDEDENYFFDFIGCKVYDENKTCLGTAIDVLCHSKQNVLIVEKDQMEFLVPIVDDFIKFFDIKKKEIIINTIEGLFDV